MQNPFSKPNILILLPLILVMILDLIFTLAGQPEYYWQNYNLFDEGSLLGPVLLSYHPAYFVLFFALYLPFVLFLVTNLIRPLNIMVAVGLFLGHGWGSSSWIPIIFNKLTEAHVDSWHLVIGYFAVIAIISGFCVNKWLKLKAIEVWLQSSSVD